MTRRLSVLLLALALPLAGCSGSFDAAGKLTLHGSLDDEFVNLEDGKTCIGFGGYDDVTEGAQVIVRDSTGKQVGLGELGAGKRTRLDDKVSLACTFAFEVPDVSGDGDIFTVEVGDRGDVSFKRSEADDIALVLGE